MRSTLRLPGIRWSGSPRPVCKTSRVTALKALYLRMQSSVRGSLERSGRLARFDERRGDSRFTLWLRSLLSIYDFDDFARLDVPWWTFRSSDAVARFLAERPGARVFEWGSGASTLWLARRAAHVTSVEHDVEWAERLAPHLPGTATLRVVPPVPASGPIAAPSQRPGYAGVDFADYVAAIDLDGALYDLVIIDGRARGSCLAAALPHVAPGGLIVVDNTDRRRNRRVVRALGDRAAVTWTFGLTPCLPYPTGTALVRPVP